MDATQIRALTKNISGWITPSGDLVSGGVFMHLPELRASGFRPDLFELWERWRKENDQATDDFVADLEPGEHPGWHAYSDPRDTNFVSQYLMASAYAAGWARVMYTVKAAARKYLAGKDYTTKIVLVESSDKTLRLHRNTILAIADVLEVEAVPVRCDLVDVVPRMWAWQRENAAKVAINPRSYYKGSAVWKAVTEEEYEAHPGVKLSWAKKDGGMHHAVEVLDPLGMPSGTNPLP